MAILMLLWCFPSVWLVLSPACAQSGLRGFGLATYLCLRGADSLWSVPDEEEGAESEEEQEEEEEEEEIDKELVAELLKDGK